MVPNPCPAGTRFLRQGQQDGDDSDPCFLLTGGINLCYKSTAEGGAGPTGFVSGLGDQVCCSHPRALRLKTLSATHLTFSGSRRDARPSLSAFSILEVALVVALLLVIASLSFLGFSSYSEWSKGREASIGLRSVYIAQRAYLADHPTEDATTFGPDLIIPYLPDGGELPSIVSLNGIALEIDLTSMPPVFLQDGAPYDPSDRPDDGLWDVGKF